MDQPAFSIAPTILATLSPPIPLAYAWARPFTTANPGTPILDLSQGTPGSPPPDVLLNALAHAAREPELAFKYGQNGGEAALREALAVEMQRAYGNEASGTAVDVRPDDIAITAGCNLAFFAALLCVAQRGDEVILPVPWYFNHHMALTMLGITPIALPALPEDSFVPRLDAAERLITQRTKAIVLVTPNNPTGAVYPNSTLRALLELARRHRVPLIVDETYRDFLPSQPHTLFSGAWRDTLVHLFSFSKSYALPGVRLGAIVAAPAFLVHLDTALDTLQICPPRAPQAALAPLLPSLRPFVARTADTLRARQAAFAAALPVGWEVGASGAYFAFVRHPFDGVRAEEVCEFLARTRGVVMLPATFFGAVGGERWIRASVASVPSERMGELRAALEDATRHFAAPGANANERHMTDDVLDSLLPQTGYAIFAPPPG